jgi:isoleucyl-tRNA synthetase
MNNKKFREVTPKITLPEIERDVLDFWKENRTFEKSLELRKKSKRYSFYDGPPFATGTPHYGHIVASTLKDVIPRYYTMKGFYVERRWGWDCHGLPIENIAEKELGIKRKKDILELGVKKFNDFCRSKVLDYADEWGKVITRLGRWADMENAYKTMDLSYMESVWWVFKELYDQGLIYEGYRSMHICPRCETTLSQSEVTEGYKTVKDLSLTAKFELIEEPGTYLLAWTTTPWTLLGNAALAVGSKIKYVKISRHSKANPELNVNNLNNVISNGSEKSHGFKAGDLSQDLEMTRNSGGQETTDQFYVMAKDRITDVLKDGEYTVVDEFTGHDLIGKKYKPLFPLFQDQKLENLENGFKVYAADFVTTEEGTGIVHIAPAFGEDDMKLGKDFDLPFIQHIDMDGVIKEGYGKFSGLPVKPIGDVQSTDVEIIKYLAEKGTLFSKEKYEHSYPHCWRCETPLLNYATSSWFVNVSKIKDESLSLAKEINWFPKYIKAGRFGKWLEGARDWSVSRQRFWASVIPIWRCSCGELKVIGSIKELEELSGKKVTDLHKHVVDEIVFPCTECGKQMKRVPDVLDTWFDSGSMPYAQVHYPFDNNEQFTKSFPAEFIAEGADQTRAWFYYLHILSTSLKKSVAFKNVIVNGIVLAEDGKKMSKRLQNYPDPMLMFDKYGADSVRFYLMSSPVVAAENLNFTEKEVSEIYRGMFRMLLNSYSFFVLYANIDGFTPVKTYHPENLLDLWILAELQELTKEVDKSMSEYNLAKASRLFPLFIDNLSNWYIRRSRKRFWKSENDGDKNDAYQTLWKTLITLSQLMAPFTPFITEDIFQNLTEEESVHLTDYPKVEESFVDRKLIEDMSIVRRVVEMGLSSRNQSGIKVRQPLSSLTYTGQKLNSELESIISDEINVKKIVNRLGPDKDLSVELNLTLTPELILEGEMREVVRQIQQARKEANFVVDDRIVVGFNSPSEKLESILSKFSSEIKKEVLAGDISAGVNQNADYQGEINLGEAGEKFWLKKE